MRFSPRQMYLRKFNQQFRDLMPYAEYTEYFDAFFREVENELMEGNRIKLPASMGFIRLCKSKRNYQDLYKTKGKAKYQFHSGNFIVKLQWMNKRAGKAAKPAMQKFLTMKTRLQFKRKITQRIETDPHWISGLEYRSVK